MRSFEESKQHYEVAQSIGWVRTKLKGIEELALDFETTALSPDEGRVRLTSIYSRVKNYEVHFIVDHDFACSLEQLISVLQEQPRHVFVYNAKFEQRWIDHCCEEHGLPQLDVLDVDFMAKSVIGGHPSSLAKMVKRDLKIDLQKEEQLSNWAAAVLTQSQLAYAAYDSVVTWELKEFWDKQMNDGHWNGFYVLNDAVRGTVQCESVGLVLDLDAHQRSVTMWERRYRGALHCFRKYAGDINPLSGTALTKLAHMIFDERTLRAWPRTGKKRQLQFESKFLMRVRHQFAQPFNRFLLALARVKYYQKYLSTYGQPLLDRQKQFGVIRGRYNIAQAITGRYSSSNPNKQNIPRNPVVRQAFKTTQGRRLVMADYSGIELRVLAELSGDEQLLQDVIYGNVHASAAAQINRINESKFMQVYKDRAHAEWAKYSEMRSRAKPFNFQLTYGAMAPSLSLILRCTVSEAEKAIELWAQRYSKAYNYRFKMQEVMQSTGFLPVTSGRTIRVFKRDQSLPVASNYPIQGAAADVMYRAVHHVHRLLREHGLDAKLAATVHDELLVSASEADAEAALALLEEGMLLGWLDIFPGSDTANLVDPVVGDTWADKP